MLVNGKLKIDQLSLQQHVVTARRLARRPPPPTGDRSLGPRGQPQRVRLRQPQWSDARQHLATHDHRCTPSRVVIRPAAARPRGKHTCQLVVHYQFRRSAAAFFSTRPEKRQADQIRISTQGQQDISSRSLPESRGITAGDGRRAGRCRQRPPSRTPPQSELGRCRRSDTPAFRPPRSHSSPAEIRPAHSVPATPPRRVPQ